MDSGPVWTPLLVAAAMAWTSVMIAFLLYRYSEATIERRGVRLGGAAAIAAVAFIGMARFYVTLRSDLEGDEAGRLRDRVSAAEQAVRAYELCAEHESPFPCLETADDLRDSCVEILDQVSSR